METKLHTAVRYGDEEAVLAALKAGLDPNQIGLLKWSPVHEAAHNGERDILNLLIKYKGDVNLQDKLHGNTALHYASKEDNSACVTALLKAGAKANIKNKDGQTCIDVATPFCKDIIQDYVNQQSYPGEWRDDMNNNPGGKPGAVTGSDGTGDLPRVPDTAAIGHLHLTFEYHKSNLKIRVWQVSDLLLPPPQISMIESIFVRSYLIPDAVKKTNRRTEDVRVEAGNKKELPRNAPLQSGIQHIFTPSSFRFETPLLYTGLTKAIVSERSVRLEVCMTQKHTRRGFLMALVHMPLSVAVRRPIRERYPLIPCMNYTIPNNMRVYSARDIILEGAGGEKRRLGGRDDDNDSLGVIPLSRSSSSTSSSRDGAGSVASQKFVSVNLSDSDDDVGEVAGILEIKTPSPSKKPSSSLSNTAHSPTSSVDIQDEDALREVVMGGGADDNIVPGGKQHTSVDIGEQDNGARVKKKIIPNEILAAGGKRDPQDSDLSDSDEDDAKGESLGAVKVSKQHSPSTVVDINQSPEDAVVDITKLQGDVVIDVGSNSKSPASAAKAHGGGSGKKKIIPPGELLSRTAQKLSAEAQKLSGANSGSGPSAGEGLNISSDSGCVYDDIASRKGGEGNDLSASNNDVSEKLGVEQCKEDGNASKTLSADEESNDKSEIVASSDFAVIVEDCAKLPRPQSSSRLRSLSEAGSEAGSTATSRPETPVWDFYDFTDEGTGEEGGEAGQREGAGGEKTGAAGGDDASKALGTLQASILRLSRSTRLGAGGNSGVLETERVSGPVLPIVMIEDFEEMEAAEEEEEVVEAERKTEEGEDGNGTEKMKKTLKDERELEDHKKEQGDS